MNKEKETMADEQTVQPQEVENGTENKTVRKSISWGRILIATLFILLAGGVSGAIWSYYYITKMFTKKTVLERVFPEPIISSQAYRPPLEQRVIPEHKDKIEFEDIEITERGYNER